LSQQQHVACAWQTCADGVYDKGTQHGGRKEQIVSRRLYFATVVLVCWAKWSRNSEAQDVSNVLFPFLTVKGSLLDPYWHVSRPLLLAKLATWSQQILCYTILKAESWKLPWYGCPLPCPK